MANYYRPRLRIFIDPIYVSSKNLSGSSTYHKYITLVRSLVARGHYVYWCIPDKEYVPNEIENHKQVGIIRTSYHQDQFVIDGLITDEYYRLFNRVTGKYHIDVLCTSRTSLGLRYKRVLESPRFHDVDREYTDKSYGLPVVIIEEFPQTIERQHSSKSYWLSQCQGYLAADTTVFLSEHNRGEVSKGMLDWFRLSVVKDWADNRTSVIPAGIECAELDKYYNPDRWKVEKGFNVISIGRIFGPSYMEYFPWFDYLYRRAKGEVSMTIALSGSLSGPMKTKFKRIGFDWENNLGRQFIVLEDNPRVNFLAMLKRFHCFIAPMSHLDHPTGIFEALYLGLPGIIPVSDYQQTYFSDYPYVIEAKDKAGLLAMLMEIKADPQKARDNVAHWRGDILEHYEAGSNISKLCDVIENSAMSYINNFRTSSGVIKLVKEFKGKSYKWADVVAHLKAAGRMGVSIGKDNVRTTFTYANSAIHHSMAVAGYVDTCDAPKAKFERRDVFDKRIIKDAKKEKGKSKIKLRKRK